MNEIEPPIPEGIDEEELNYLINLDQIDFQNNIEIPNHVNNARTNIITYFANLPV